MIFQKKKAVDAIQASLTDTSFEKSAPGRKKNQYLLEEA